MGDGENSVPYQGFPDGLYLLKQPSARKVGINHYGIWDIGNRIGLEGADGVNPVVVHQVLEGLRPEWFQDTGSWTVLGKITDEPGALHRLEISFRDPGYRLFDNNCEHFARYIATGVKESSQVQAAGFVAGLAVLAFIASRGE